MSEYSLNRVTVGNMLQKRLSYGKGGMFIALCPLYNLSSILFCLCLRSRQEHILQRTIEIGVRLNQ